MDNNITCYTKQTFRMTKNFIISTLIFCLTTICSCGQRLKSTSGKFLDFLNNYQTDSLSVLLADSFHLQRTYTTYTNDKTSFIDEYVPNSKNLNGKYKVLKATYNELTAEFLVEDQSDYYKYLNVDSPKWKIILTTNNQDKIMSMTIDTTESYQSYLLQIKQKDEDFESWLKTNYPNETKDALYSTTGLLTRRLKEYAKKHIR